MKASYETPRSVKENLQHISNPFIRQNLTINHLDGDRDDSDCEGQVAYDTEDSDDDSMIPDEELPNVVLITKVNLY